MNLFTFEDGIHFIGGELFGVQLVYAKTIERGAVALLEDAVDPVAWGAQASLNDRLALAHFPHRARGQRRAPSPGARGRPRRARQGAARTMAPLRNAALALAGIAREGGTWRTYRAKLTTLELIERTRGGVRASAEFFE